MRVLGLALLVGPGAGWVRLGLAGATAMTVLGVAVFILLSAVVAGVVVGLVIDGVANLVERMKGRR